MTTLRDAAQQALDAIESGKTFDHLDNEVAPYLRAALVEPTTEDSSAVEPVEWLTGCPECGMDGGCDCPSGTYNPPQRKPLTEEEISSLWDGHVVPVFGKNGINPIVFARAVERAHGIT